MHVASITRPKVVPLVVKRVTKRAGYRNGAVLILMYHNFGPTEHRYQRSYKNFRRDLTRLDAMGFRPVLMRDYIADKMNLPPGASPIILTFDDACDSQFELRKDGSVDPHCAIGIWQDFAKTHPEFPLKGTFYILPRLFGDKATRGEKARLLGQWGCELASHTWTHPFLAKSSDAKMEREVAKSFDMLRDFGFTNPSLAYPYGSKPRDAWLLKDFKYRGKEYRVPAGIMAFYGIARSPLQLKGRMFSIPRVEVCNFGPSIDYWLRRIQEGRTAVYVEP